MPPNLRLPMAVGMRILFGNNVSNASFVSKRRDGTFIRRVPNCIRAYGKTNNVDVNTAAWIMEWWATQAEFELTEKAKEDFDIKKAPHALRILDVEVLKKWRHVKNFNADTFAQSISGLDQKRRQDFIKNLTQMIVAKMPGVSLMDTARVLATAGNADINFPVLPDVPKLAQALFADPTQAGTLNQPDWLRAAIPWCVGFAGDGAGFYELGKQGVFGTFDDLGLFLGRFAWVWYPKGFLSIVEGKYQNKLPSGQVALETKFPAVKVQINDVGVFAWDSYDFTGPQPLGVFCVDAGKESIGVDVIASGAYPVLASDAGYYLYKDVHGVEHGMGEELVTNGAFCQYRKETKLGRDVVIYSDPAVVRVQPRVLWFRLDTGQEIPGPVISG